MVDDKCIIRLNVCQAIRMNVCYNRRKHKAGGMQHMQFNERIKGLREDADMLQKDLAEILGITSQQYSLYETGKRSFKVEHIITLCQYFHVSADYVLGLPKGLPYGKSITK